MSTIGFPDGQRITQWLGAPLVQATALAIGNVLHTDGPFNLASWASVIVAVKPTGGNVSVTVRQRVSGAPPSLELSETFVVPAGSTLFTSVVLFGDSVYLDLTGSAPGVTVDYAVYPANTTTNAQVLASALLNFQRNEVLVAAEPTVDFVDASGITWTLTDDPTNTRMKVAPLLTGLTRGRGVDIAAAASITVDHQVHAITAGANIATITATNLNTQDNGAILILIASAAFTLDNTGNIVPQSSLAAKAFPANAAVPLVYSNARGWVVALGV